MDDEITVETVDDLRRAILSKVRTAQDIQTLNGLKAEDFGLDDELLNATYRVVVGNVQRGLPPPSVGAVSIVLKKRPLEDLVEQLRTLGTLARVGIVLEDAVKKFNDGRLTPAGYLDYIHEGMAEIKETNGGGDTWKQIPLEEVKAMSFPDQRWLWDGYIGAGEVTLLAASAKEGKSTLIFHLLPHLLSSRPFLERETSATKVLIVTEEQPRQIQEKLGSASYENSFIVCNPFGVSWDVLLANIRRAIETEGIGLVILDTLANLWQVGDENNQADVLKALRPVLSISRTFTTAFLLVHHDRKESGGGIMSVRGSTALPAAVDMVLKLSGVQGHETRRILSAKGRASDTPAALMIELDLETQEYKAIGAPTLVEQASVRAKVLTMLPFGKVKRQPGSHRNDDELLRPLD